VNVEVLQCSSGQLSLRMEFGECVELGESFVVDLAAILTNAAQQSLSRSTKGSVLPSGVSFSGAAFLTLENPLQGVIDDPPTLVELGYEPI
jgi:hypothetical protein